MNVEELKAVVADQREEVGRALREERIIDREALERWREWIESDMIKVVMGARRSGKSIFSLQLLRGKSHAYVNFDDERLVDLDASQLNLLFEALLQVYGDFKFILLDEVQNVHGWELFVSRLRRQGFNLVITGSNAKLLSKELATHLTGRHIPIEIFPFSFREFLEFDGLVTERKAAYSTREKAVLMGKLQEYIQGGGFPEAVRIKDAVKARMYLQTLYSTVVTKDVISRHRIRFLKTIREISNYLVSNFSQPVSFNKVKNVFGLQSVHTSKNYVSYLEETYLIFLIEKYSRKRKESLNSPKKVYCIDCGMINAVGFRSSENLGRLMENAVAVELLRRRSEDPSLELYYWRDYQQREVDFVLKGGEAVRELLQVTYSSGRDEVEKREVAALTRAGRELGVDKLTVVTWDHEGVEVAEGREVRFVPLWKWLRG